MTEIPDAAMLMAMVKNAGAGFTDSKWDELLALIDSQAEAIERVRELHSPAVFGYETYCSQCYGEYEQNYPCDTIKALDGVGNV